MIAIADGGCYPFYLSTFYLLWLYGSDYRRQVQADRLRQVGRQAPGRQAGSSQAGRQTGRLKSGSQAEVRLGDDGSLGKDVCS